MPRSNVNITDSERAAYNAFCLQNNIVNDSSPAAIKNGDEIGGYIVQQWLEDITEHTLGVALEQLRDRLTFISPEQAEVQDILSKLDQGQRDTVAAWLAKNHRLETEGVKGFNNVSLLVSWLLNRRFAVSESGLDMALGNVQNSSKRKIYWKASPKQSREYVQGRPNHAFNQEEKPKAAAGQQQEYVNGRKNHSWTPPEDATKKAVAPVDAWSEIINLQMREWSTPSQQARLENEYNAGLAAGRSRRDISASLAAIIRDQQRGR